MADADNDEAFKGESVDMPIGSEAAARCDLVARFCWFPGKDDADELDDDVGTD